MAGPVSVAVDWARDGSFATLPYDDVTDRVRGAVTATFGRDQSTALQPVVAGRGSFDLDNSDRLYSPRNASSGLYGKLKPARPVLVTRAVSGTTYTIIRAHTDDTPINPDLDSKRVTLNLIDSLGDFRNVNVTTVLYQGLRSGDAVNKVLDAAGWTGGRDIDPGASMFPWWWVDGKDAFTALQEILASEGPPAMLSVGTSGEIVFRDREHRLVRAASKTPQATMRGDGVVEPVMGRGFQYNDAWQNVVNSPQFNISERSPGAVQTAVWTSDEIVNIDPSQSYVVVLSTSDPFFNATTPVAGTDYQVVSGSVTGVSLSRTSGGSTSITFTAGGSGAQINGVQLRAQSVPVVRTYQITASASAQSTANVPQSITDYGQRGMASGTEPIWCTRFDGQAIADLMVLQRAQPLPLLTVRFIASDLQTSRLAAVLALDLSDRVTVVEPETQVNGDYFVESISHTIEGIHSHEVVLGLEAVPPTPTSVFIIGTSVLNGADVLGY